MPARNKRSTKAERFRADGAPERPRSAQEPLQVVVGAAPKASPPVAIVQKTLQDALIDGYNDPVMFARDFLDVDPYPKQCEFLRSMRDTSESNFVAGNRVGKSWLGGVALTWKAFYRHISPYTRPERVTPHNVYKSVSVSLTLDQAKLAWNYALTFMSTSKRFKPFLQDYIYNPFPTIYLKTRNEKGEVVPSEVWARSLAKNGLYLLGHSINFILPDECAYIPKYPTIEDEVIRMRLADTGGSIMRISTPNGRNFFYNYFQQGQAGDPRFFSYRITTLDNPYVSREYVDQQKERMIPEYYAQNVLAEFVSLSDFFRVEDIQKLYTTPDGDAIELTLPQDPTPKGVYVMGADLGALRDPTVVEVWRIDGKDPQVVFLGAVQNGRWEASRAYVRTVYERYRPVRTVIDATGNGQPIFQQLIDEDGLEGTEGFIFSHTSKPDIMTRLQDAVQRRKFTFPYTLETQTLVQQLSFYRLDDKDIKQDYVIATALANRAYELATANLGLDTEIYDDLAVISVLRGGEGLIGADVMGPGTIFQLDPTTGLYIPAGDADEFDFSAF